MYIYIFRGHDLSFSIYVKQIELVRKKKEKNDKREIHIGHRRYQRNNIQLI
jgi:hypothetical protein